MGTKFYSSSSHSSMKFKHSRRNFRNCLSVIVSTSGDMLIKNNVRGFFASVPFWGMTAAAALMDEVYVTLEDSGSGFCAAVGFGNC